MEKLRPFGPTICRTILPDDIYSALLQITDEVLADEYRENIGDRLAGEIQEQNMIPVQKLIQYGVLQYFLEEVDTYFNQVFAELNGITHESKLTTCWVNSMYKHEWNPIHTHSQTLSSIVVLKVPQDLAPPEGMISFTNNSSRIPFELEHGTQLFIPQEKHFYLFPARLSHAVNPFTCLGERRTISFNINTVISEK